MANSRVRIGSRLDDGKQKQSRGSSLLKTSIMSDDTLVDSLLSNSIKEKTTDKNKNNTTASSITEESKDIIDEKDTLKDEEIREEEQQKEISFNTNKRKMQYIFENEEDMKKLSYDIDVIVFKATNDVQVVYEKDKGEMKERKYIDKVKNSFLLKQVYNEVKDLVLKTNMDEHEMNDYFTSVIDKCIHDRFDFIVEIGLNDMLSPAEIESLLRGFVNIDILDEDIINDYISEYMELVNDVVYNRVDKYTFFISEIVNEAIRLMQEDTRKGISTSINELLYKSIDRKYIELAKINIKNRKPRHTKMMKNMKKKLKNK